MKRSNAEYGPGRTSCPCAGPCSYCVPNQTSGHALSLRNPRSSHPAFPAAAICSDADICSQYRAVFQHVLVITNSPTTRIGQTRQDVEIVFVSCTLDDHVTPSVFPACARNQNWSLGASRSTPFHRHGQPQARRPGPGSGSSPARRMARRHAFGADQSPRSTRTTPSPGRTCTSICGKGISTPCSRNFRSMASRISEEVDRAKST